MPMPPSSKRRRSAAFAGLAAGATALSLLQTPATAATRPAKSPTDTRLGRIDMDKATIPQLERLMRSGQLSSVAVTTFYLNRIRRVDPLLHAVLQVNPDALAEARLSDRARRTRGSARLLEGIPVLLKDNVGTHDREHTTAGSLALLGARPADAALVTKLRNAGAVIIGKANLSEWANFRSTQSSSGWSGVGGQTNNPYALDRNPCGSSSGSGAGIAATLAQVAIGTETDGSIVCPSGANGLVGVKPTLGLVSRTGVVPLSAQQDTPGPMARNTEDAAIVLSAIHGVDAADPATREQVGHVLARYQDGLRGSTLAGKRIGLYTQGVLGQTPEGDAVFNAAVAKLKALGATVVTGADPAGGDAINTAESLALPLEFKHDINAYLAALPGTHPRDLAGLIAFNKANARREMPFFGQEIFEQAQATSGDETEPAYVKARQDATGGARKALDDVLGGLKLDAIVSLTNGPAWTTDLVNGDHFSTGSSTFAAVSGYPSVTVPAGYTNGLPIGISFTGRRWSEETLLRLAFAFEKGNPVRKAPTYAATLPVSDGVRARLQRRGFVGSMQGRIG